MPERAPIRLPRPPEDRRYIALDGHKVRTLREQKFGNQGALAAKAGLAVGTIASAEHGAAIRRRNALDISTALDVDLHALLPRLQRPEAIVAAAADDALRGWDPFTDLIEEKTGEFVGREYVLSAVDAFVAKETHGYCVIEGDPGMGKSSILAKWVVERSCIAFFNVRSMGLNRASQFLESICQQLVDRFRLPYSTLPQEATRDGAFLARLLGEASAKARDHKKIVIAVDALDEVDLTSQSLGANVLYLPAWLPPDVYFVLTRRRKAAVPFMCQAPQQVIDLLDFPTESRRDIVTYVKHVALREQLHQWIKRANLTHNGFAETLADKSENNFMYLHYVLPDIERGSYRDLTLEMLPAGLEGYYDDHWRLMGMMQRPLKRSKLKVIYVLSEVRQPVARRLLADFTSEDETTVQEILDDWSQFLHEEIVEDPGNTSKRFSLYHASFRDFLHRQDIIAAAELSLPQIHGMIADDLLNKLFPNRSESGFG